MSERYSNKYLRAATDDFLKATYLKITTLSNCYRKTYIDHCYPPYQLIMIHIKFMRIASPNNNNMLLPDY